MPWRLHFQLLPHEGNNSLLSEIRKNSNHQISCTNKRKLQISHIYVKYTPEHLHHDLFRHLFLPDNTADPVQPINHKTLYKMHTSNLNFTTSYLIDKVLRSV